VKVSIPPTARSRRWRRRHHQGRAQYRAGQGLRRLHQPQGRARDDPEGDFRRPTRSDLDLSKLPGGLPALASVKLVNYDEQKWTDARAKTMEQIKDTLQESR